MGSPLPNLTRDVFETRLRAALPGDVLADWNLRPGWTELLWQHYEEMRRWNPKLSLVGPGTAADAVERHYAESLRALPLIRSGDRSEERPIHVLDVGTGGGFPGLVLAAARADLDVVLVEPNSRKCSFLEAARRRLRKIDPSLSCRVLGARVDGPVDETRVASGRDWPDAVGFVTSRALAWNSRIHQSLLDRWPTARFLLWIGRELPELPPTASVERELLLESGPLDHGRIVEISHRSRPS